MIYKNGNDLLQAVIGVDISNTEGLKHLHSLCDIYYDALTNPPPGVIGVGAISYAERVLIAEQNNA